MDKHYHYVLDVTLGRAQWSECFEEVCDAPD